MGNLGETTGMVGGDTALVGVKSQIRCLGDILTVKSWQAVHRGRLLSQTGCRSSCNLCFGLIGSTHWGLSCKTWSLDHRQAVAYLIVIDGVRGERERE